MAWKRKAGASWRLSGWCRCSLQSAQLRAGTHAHQALALHRYLLHLHAARRARLHLSRLRRARGAGRRWRSVKRACWRSVCWRCGVPATPDRQSAQGPMINADELKRRRDAGGRSPVLDVRAPKSSAANSATFTAHAICPWRNCPAPWRTGTRARHAHRPSSATPTSARQSRAATGARRLQSCVVLRGGMTQWRKQGFPVD